MPAAEFEAFSVQSLTSTGSDFGINLAPRVPGSWADESAKKLCADVFGEC